MQPADKFFELEVTDSSHILRLTSRDTTNRLTRSCVLALIEKFRELALNPHPLIIAGNKQFFSVGADLNEIAALTGSEALEFSQTGQTLMNAIAGFPHS